MPEPSILAEKFGVEMLHQQADFGNLKKLTIFIAKR